MGDPPSLGQVYLVLDPPHLPAVWANATLWSLAKEGPLSYVAFNWKATVLIATGFLGGIFSSISGSGIDICSFACLTLLFRVCLSPQSCSKDKERER